MEKVFVGCWCVCVCEKKEQQQDNSIEIRAAIYSSVERQLEKNLFFGANFFFAFEYARFRGIRGASKK